jgi:serine/threonine-protein kinase
MHRLRNVLAYSFFFGLFFIVGLYFFDRWTMTLFVRHGQSKPIPHICNMTLEEAEKKAAEYGFRVKINHSDYSELVEAGRVMSQFPDSGALAKSGRRIKVITSLGVEMTVVPDIINKPQREARLALSSAKLSPGNVTEEHSDSVMENFVIRCTPYPGDSVYAWSTVNFVISLGALEAEVPVPNFIGMSVEDINAMKKDLNIAVFYKYRRIPSIRENTVYQQSKPAGSMVLRGSYVELLVSQGSE